MYGLYIEREKAITSQYPHTLTFQYTVPNTLAFGRFEKRHDILSVTLPEYDPSPDVSDTVFVDIIHTTAIMNNSCFITAHFKDELLYMMAGIEIQIEEC